MADFSMWTVRSDASVGDRNLRGLHRGGARLNVVAVEAGMNIRLDLTPPVPVSIRPTSMEFRFIHSDEVEAWLRSLADEIHQASRPVEDDSALVGPASKRLRR